MCEDKENSKEPEEEFDLIEDVGKGFKSQQGWSGKEVEENEDDEKTEEKSKQDDEDQNQDDKGDN